MSKHTPGPWVIYGSGGPWERDLAIRAPNWGCVAQVTVDPSMPHWDEPQRANARLIAAAPELLAALLIAKQYVQVEGSDDEFEQVCAAIAAATGEQA